MQDRYAGDVGDYGKFALLKHILKSTRYCLGVNWYKYPDESHNNDGLHVNYLIKEKFKTADGELCVKLQSVLDGGRSIDLLEKSALLPDDTVFFSESLDGHVMFPTQTNSDRDNCLKSRTGWHQKAMSAMGSCDAIFLDPDNGLEIPSLRVLSGVKSGKFAYRFVGSRYSSWAGSSLSTLLFTATSMSLRLAHTASSGILPTRVCC